MQKIKTQHHKTVLSSGLTAVSENIPGAASIAVGLWLARGSRDESQASRGMCHFIEHMAFKGTKTRSARDIALCQGGPVDHGRGFVLHTSDWMVDESMRVNQDVALTASVEVLKAIATGGGPRAGILALGYANWGPGQLDDEMRQQLEGFVVSLMRKSGFTKKDLLQEISSLEGKK